MEAIAGPDPLDPTTTNRPYAYATDPTEKRWRLGVLKGVTIDVDESVRSNFAQTLQVLAQVASIEEVELPEWPYAITRTILFAEAASAFEEFIESGKVAELTAPEDHYGPYVRIAVLAKDYIRACACAASSPDRWTPSSLALMRWGQRVPPPYPARSRVSQRCWGHGQRHHGCHWQQPRTTGHRCP